MISIIFQIFILRNDRAADRRKTRDILRKTAEIPFIRSVPAQKKLFFPAERVLYIR